MPANDNAVLVSLNDVCNLTSLSRTQINRMRAANRFPQPVTLGERRITFVRTEVMAWLKERIDARGRRDAA